MCLYAVWVIADTVKEKLNPILGSASYFLNVKQNKSDYVYASYKVCRGAYLKRFLKPKHIRDGPLKCGLGENSCLHINGR